MRHAPPVIRREWRMAALVALLTVIVTTAPYVAAWSALGDDWRFSGFLFGIEDGHSYLGKMRLGARGLWDFYLFYTPEPHDSAPLIFLPYILPGQLVGRFVADTDPALPNALAVTFHVMRAAANGLLVLALYRFIAAFARAPRVRLTALLLALFGGGLGWLLALVGLVPVPPEFYIPEGFSFLILFGLPHLALARAALLLGLLALFEGDDKKPSDSAKLLLRHSVLAGLCWLIVGLAVPFYLVIVYLIVGVWGLAIWVRERRFPLWFGIRAGVAAGVTLPMFAYFGVTFTSNAAFAQWSAQNQLQSPPVLHTLAAYALLIVPAWVGGRFAWRRARLDSRYALLVAWVLVVPLLVYLPVNVQRRMAEGVIVPLAVLAALGLSTWARTIGLKRRRSARRFTRAAVALIVAASMSSLFVLLGGFLAAGNVHRPLFRPVDELTMYAWLNAHAAPDDVVLASVLTGNALPAFTNQRPYMGHGPETLDWQVKTADVQRFYSGAMTSEERRALYAAWNIRYVMYGALERQIAPDAAGAPAWADDLTVVYDADGYTIYAVNAAP